MIRVTIFRRRSARARNAARSSPRRKNCSAKSVIRKPPSPTSLARLACRRPISIVLHRQVGDQSGGRAPDDERGREAAREIALGSGSAAERLRALVMTIETMNAARYLSDRKLHDMVERR